MFKKSKLMVCMAILAAMFIAVPATVTVNAMTQGNFEFEVVGGQMTIVEFTGTGGSVTIPNTAPNGAAVVAIGERAFADVALTAVTFQSPSSIHTIRQEAFRWSDVNNITLPNSLRTIEAGAFRNTRLAQVTIPSGVEHIGHQAFRDVTTLREAHFLHLDGRDITLGNNVFTNVASNFEITRLPQATHFGSNWYPPHTVRASDAPFTDGADWRWTALTGNNIMITGIAANSDLATAQRIEIPSQIDGRTVRRIQNRAFDHHPNLREVVIPATINEIEARAFNNNSRLVAAYFLHTDGNTVEFRPEAFFGFHNDFTIFYPAGARGFTTPYWRELPARPHESEGAWESTVLAGTNELMITRFTGDASIVTVPSTLDGRRVSYIGNDVIRNNNTITELIIPDTIVSIAANAVVNAPNLRIIRLRHMYADTLHLSGLAFSGLHRDFTILFPANSEGFTTPLFVGFPAEPDLFGANWEFTISGGAATITRYHGEEEHATIPEYIDGVPVRIIATGAFRDNDTLLRVTIPATVTTIQPNAFYNCRRLYSAHLLHTNASTLTNFARNSFVGVATYFRIVFPNNATGFTTPTWNGYFAAPEADALTLRQDNFEYIIRREAIQGTSGPTHDVVIITRYLGDSTALVIPSMLGTFPVVAIGDFAFQQNRTLTRVTIPQSVRDIGHSSFLGVSTLQSVRLLHSSAAGLSVHENTFRYTASNFTILYTPNATGFTTPTWQGWPARPYTGAAQGPTTPGTGNQGDLNNPLIHTSRTLDSTSNFMTRDGYMLTAPIFRLEPFAPNREFSTSYVMVRVIADILGLDWAFNPQTNTATFSGYNAENEHITMELVLGSTMMRVNGVQQEVRASAGVVPAISRDGRTFVPVLVFQEVYGVTIQWNGTTRTVTVNPPVG